MTTAVRYPSCNICDRELTRHGLCSFCNAEAAKNAETLYSHNIQVTQGEAVKNQRYGRIARREIEDLPYGY